ncbi:MAG: hypothetical protein JWO47_878 [Candidatus Saccharibacteria bacterium]|nr:hypothetical protein [Candidatus Saccharibacteria bacterium]
MGILKTVAQYDGWRAVGDSFDGYDFKDEPQDLSRAIKNYTGKKDKRAQSLLEDVISFISKNPKGEGSLTLRGLDKGQGTPMYNNQRVQLWRFKPSDVATLPNSEMLRKVRIVYAVVELEDEQEVLGIVDIINRGDFEKKYN